MVKYILAATALKCFSAGPQMRGLYRGLGNLAGGRRRSSGKIPSYYLERIKRLLHLQREYNLVRNGDRIIEIGTGWLHWEAITTRLFFDVEAVLFDVWDNRQLIGLKNYVGQLTSILGTSDFDLSSAELKRAQSLIQAIVKVNSFRELYRLLGFEYLVESSGSLRQLPANSFQLVASGGVLEHVTREDVSSLVSEMQRVLKPGGWSLHSIDTQDHLSYYDARVSRKMYLAFSDRTWRSVFENRVQYINRLQRSEWIELFKTAGFELIDEDSWYTDLGQIKLAERFAKMDRHDLECTGPRFLHSKPA
ncbi:MAG TPA: methyltransferase domain-containing protein [Candidatus Acidoferrum sp.]|nr:methyltransferase domain-containing protein [Candidatus Acidoferrum sp.]